jgi:sec-independent protein translocase protein TatB
VFFDIAWPELILIGAVALVVIGPKDLPRAMRIAGYWLRKARTLSREFQSSVDQMIRESELDEMRQELNKVGDFNIESEFHKTIDPTGELGGSLTPPALPDYFDETPASPATEAELEPELPGLEPPPHHAADTDVENAPPPDASEISAAPPSDVAALAGEPARETAPPKP